jgi:outer membrane autotransporter protein
MGAVGLGFRHGAVGPIKLLAVVALCGSALVPVTYAAQFDVTATDLNGAASQAGSTAWALEQAHSLPGSHVVDFDDSVNLVLTAPQQVQSDTTLQINRHLVVSGALAGPGNISKTGTGYLVITTNSTLTGNLDIQRGGVVVTAGDAIGDNAPVTMASGTELEVIGNETIGSLSGAGALMGSDTYTNVLTFGGNNASTSFHGEAPNDNLLGNVACYELQLVKTGEGTFTVTGILPVPSLTIEGGKVVMNGSTGGVTNVRSGAALGGTGSLGSVDIGGILAPGNSIGTIQTGDATFQVGSVLQIEVAPGGNTPGVHNDLVEVTGTVTINGGTVEILGGNGTFDATTFTIITSTNGVTGEFDAVTDDLAFYEAALRYDADNVYADLLFTGYSGGTAHLSPNQQATSQALDTIPGTGPYRTPLANVTYDTVGDAMNQLSGAGHAQQQASLIGQSGHVQDAALDRVAQSFAALQPGANSYLPSRIAPDAAPANAVWGSVYGGVVDRAATAVSLASHDSAAGLVLGLDGEVAPDWRLGLLASGGLSRFSAGSQRGTGSSATAGVYLGGRAGIIDIKAGAAYTRHFVQSSRAVTFGGLSDTLSAQYQAGTAQVFAEVSHEFDLGATSVTPFGWVELLRQDADGFTETGGAGALSTAASTMNQARTTLGVSADYAFVLGDATLGKVAISAGWEHVFGDAATVSNSFVAGGSAFTVAAAPVVRDALRLGAGVSLDINETLALSASYDGRLADGLAAHAIAIELAGRF